MPPGPSGFGGGLPGSGSTIPKEVAITNGTEPLLKLRKRTAPLKVGRRLTNERFFSHRVLGYTKSASSATAISLLLCIHN